jgi:hypothetical protein
VHRSLETWLLGQGSPPGETVLRAARLAAYAFTVLPTAHPMRAALRSDYLASLGRHHRIKAEVAPLLRAWRADGIEVLLFKGFQLSEFVYSLPAARFHGDVDVLLQPAELHHAERIATELGWRSRWVHTHRLRQHHNAFYLDRPHGCALIDVHRQMLHVRLPWYPAQRRITAAAWSDSRARAFDGLTIREPSPVDMVLVGLMLQRCWSGEEWQLKPHDLVDFRQITARFGVTRDQLWERARRLRCERTVAAFLERCDPDRFSLSPLSRRERRRLDWRVMRERGPLGSHELFLARAFAAPVDLPRALTFVPTVLRVQSVLRRHTDIRSLFDALSAKHSLPRARRDTQGARPSGLSCEAVVFGVRWASRLLGSGASGVCLVRALSLFVALRDRGWPVDFVSGVRRDATTIVGHAWVELEGAPLLPDRPDTIAGFDENVRVSAFATTSVLPAPTRGDAIPVVKAAPAPPPQTWRG